MDTRAAAGEWRRMPKPIESLSVEQFPPWPPLFKSTRYTYRKIPTCVGLISSHISTIG